jgi:hypothetical protein
MNILGVTQGSNLRVFLRLTEMLREPLGIKQVAAYVADSQEFYALEAHEPSLRSTTLPLLKEWEITRDGVNRAPDWAVLRKWEVLLGDPVLWNALLADRRIFFGRMCKRRQDYRPRFSHEQMYGIAQTAIERMAVFLDKQAPDVILGFGTSTFGDYLLYRFARARGIPYLQLKATKIGNYVALNDDAVHLSGHIAALINDPKTIPSAALNEARQHLTQIRQRGLRYEGALKSSTQLSPTKALIGGLRGLVRDFKNQRHPVIRYDNHVESAFLNALYAHLIQPLKSLLLQGTLRGVLVRHEQLKNCPPFVFFPLHFEPEVSLQVFGRPFQNQIEVIRNLALSLPAGMQVLVKEHPRALGFRPYGYYQKLLEIPNVKLVDPLLSTHLVIRQSEMVAVISGSTGFEAAVLGKPVIVFGLPTYSNLPRSMMRMISSPHQLGAEIQDLLEGFHTDESALENFVAAHIEGSVGVDLYSALLAKPGRHSEGREALSEQERRKQDYESLAKYCSLRVDAEWNRSKINEG